LIDVSIDESPAVSVERPLSLFDGLFHSTGIDGLYARTGLYERVVTALGAFITEHRPDGAEVLAFPPVMNRAQIERQGYLKSFPNLLGVVSCLCGSEREVRRWVEGAEEGEDWTAALSASDLVLSPAACYPVYPMVAARGPLPAKGALFDVTCDCFRREPSTDIDRLQSFRMREFVRIGSPEQVIRFRSAWIERGRAMARRLGLTFTTAVASDPFFGRGGQLAAKSQAEQELKFELLIPVRSEASPTACMSFNYHQDHFAETWGMTSEAGSMPHSVCVAFGIDRLALALFAAHGLHLGEWPGSVREALRL
jgi:seryl-tRNA synthetase